MGEAYEQNMKRRKTFVLYAIMTGYSPRLMMKMDTVPMRSAHAADFSSDWTIIPIRIKV